MAGKPLCVHVPVLPPSPNAIRREHWSRGHRRVKVERRAVELVLAPYRRPRLPVVVTLTRESSGVLDDDNAVGAMKAVRDAVAAWLRVDDRDTRVTWVVKQARIPRFARPGTLLEIEARA